jgi:hypothetical protein
LCPLRTFGCAFTEKPAHVPVKPRLPAVLSRLPSRGTPAVAVPLRTYITVLDGSERWHAAIDGA